MEFDHLNCAAGTSDEAVDRDRARRNAFDRPDDRRWPRSDERQSIEFLARAVDQLHAATGPGVHAANLMADRRRVVRPVNGRCLAGELDRLRREGVILFDRSGSAVAKGNQHLLDERRAIQ